MRNGTKDMMNLAECQIAEKMGMVGGRGDAFIYETEQIGFTATASKPGNMISSMYAAPLRATVMADGVDVRLQTIQQSLNLIIKLRTQW